MKEDYKNDWAEASLVKDLNYLKTGVEEYSGKKDYYSTGSIKDDSISSEGSYTYVERPSRANRVGQAGDILQARMKDTDKAVLITNNLNDQLFSTGFFQIRTDSRTILPKYLFYYFKSYLFLNQKDSNCSGSTQSALNDKSAQKLLVPIAPIPIQRAIVAKIEEFFSDLDKGIADLKKAQDQLKVYRQAVLKKAFEGELTKEWREQQTDLPTAELLLEQIKEERQKHYIQQVENWKQEVRAWEENGKEGKKPGKPTKLKPFQELNLEELSDLPKQTKYWLWTVYENICSRVRNGISKKPNEDPEGDKIFRISAVRPSKFDLTDFRLITNNREFDDYLLKKGDLIFTRYNGTRNFVGVCAMFNSDERYLYPDKLIQTRILTSIFNPLFVEYASNCSATRKFVEFRIRTTAGQSGISGSDIKSMPIPVCSIPEQNQIISEIESRLSVCDKVEESITESLEKAKALRQSILKKAFEGTLLSEEEIAACKAAPDYEPASVLLEKIKAETLRQAQGKKRK